MRKKMVEKKSPKSQEVDCVAIWLRVLGSNIVADLRLTLTLANSSPKFNFLVMFVNN